MPLPHIKKHAFLAHNRFHRNNSSRSPPIWFNRQLIIIIIVLAIDYVGWHSKTRSVKTSLFVTVELYRNSATLTPSLTKSIKWTILFRPIEHRMVQFLATFVHILKSYSFRVWRHNTILWVNIAPWWPQPPICVNSNDVQQLCTNQMASMKWCYGVIFWQANLYLRMFDCCTTPPVLPSEGHKYSAYMGVCCQ